ncbi:hypothetical protein VN12_04355 [Pirellula sp. SH-Sr6A]|uniref:head decoration protein n=1 Tax=Pirellula sp. SH-Sr6A TaxID=1632865 RepID=UPI00078BD4B0|nr:head decoration protein [Pirellula sp. SH-Sr6A]AMV31325.1 hypothetical protein VN12_04355 [Pirellula sp. SH-Sr6A]
MLGAGHFGIPGVSAAQSTYEAELLWGGDESRIQVLRGAGRILSSAVDAGNTPTSVLRKGLLLGKVTASGKLKQWDPDGTDGSQFIDSILPVESPTTDGYGTAVERFVPTFVAAPVKASQLLIEGSALVGSTAEFQARRALHEMGFRLDDDPQGYLAGVNPRSASKSTDYTVVHADNGTIFYADTANATFTLPALRAGLSFEFVRTSDHNLVVASAEGDNMVVGNDASADSITYSSAGNRLGARIRVRSEYFGTTLKWIPELVVVPFTTGTLMTITLAS